MTGTLAPSIGDTIDRGKAWYNGSIRQVVETRANVGKYLVINVETGEYFLGDDDAETAIAGRSRFGDAPLYGLRVGYRYADAVGAALHLEDTLAGEDAGNGSK